MFYVCYRSVSFLLQACVSILCVLRVHAIMSAQAVDMQDNIHIKKEVTNVDAFIAYNGVIIMQ